LYKKEDLKWYIQLISGKICLIFYTWSAININQYMRWWKFKGVFSYPPLDQERFREKIV
jgi:hypothetical protein